MSPLMFVCNSNIKKLIKIRLWLEETKYVDCGAAVGKPSGGAVRVVNPIRMVINLG